MATQHCYINNPNPPLSKAHLTTFNLHDFKMVEAMELTHYCIEVPLNGITSLPNSMKIYQSIQKLLVKGHTDRETSDFISLLSFLGNMLKIIAYLIIYICSEHILPRENAGPNHIALVSDSARRQYFFSDFLFEQVSSTWTITGFVPLQLSSKLLTQVTEKPSWCWIHGLSSTEHMHRIQQRCVSWLHSYRKNNAINSTQRSVPDNCGL
jgi:hypothetical protein